MDTMRTWEVNDYIKSLKYVDRTFRELSRYSNYIYAQSLSGKKELKLSDIMSLPWDDEGKEEHIYSREEEETLKRKASILKNIIDNGQIKIEEAKLI